LGVQEITEQSELPRVTLGVIRGSKPDPEIVMTEPPKDPVNGATPVILENIIMLNTGPAFPTPVTFT
jgi:uncharacterized NAD-dependent epimerase/dehydratase family protein